MTNTQTLHKAATGYYNLHREELLKAGWVIKKETDEILVLELSKSADEDTKAVQSGTYDPKESVR